MALYAAYGFVVETDLDLPFLKARSDGMPDLTIRYVGRSDVLAELGTDRRELAQTRNGWCLRYIDRVGNWVSYTYSRTTRSVSVATTMGWAECRFPLTGVVFGALIALEGDTPLHGAAVAVGAVGVLLLGASGHGKSTLANTLLARGATFLTDDVVALRDDAGRMAVMAGAQAISLGSDVLATLSSADLGTTRERRTDRDKHVLAPRGGLQSAPLGVIVTLERREPDLARPVLEPVEHRHATIALLTNRYGLWTRATSSADLSFCAGLAERHLIFRLRRPEGLANLAETARLIEAAVA